jgi:hypothetical protein
MGARRIHAEIRSDGYVADSPFECLEALKAIQLTDQPKESSRRAQWQESSLSSMFKRSEGNAVWSGTDASGDLLHAYLSDRMGKQLFCETRRQ